MQNTQSNASKLFFMLLSAINKKVVKAEISFFGVQGNYIHSSQFYNSFSN